jgi:hypothetical protein
MSEEQPQEQSQEQAQGQENQQVSPWTSGLSEEQIGFIENKRWENPVDMLSGYQNLEKMMGGDHSTLMRLPSERTPESMADIYQKLGRPEDASGYDLGLDESEKEFSNLFTAKAHALGLNVEEAKGITDALAEWASAHEETSTQEQKVALDQSMEALRKEWGAKHDANIQIAKQGANEFGIDADKLNGIEKAIGFDATMKLMHAIGSKIGEASFESNDGHAPGFNAAMTPGQAQASLAGLGMDKEWVAAFNDPGHVGHKAAVEKKSMLTRYAYPEPSK